MKFFTITSIASALLAAVAPAAAAPLQKRDVWAPKVLYPHAVTVWYKGQTHNVTWDTSNAPKQITNNEFFITLGSGISPNPNAEQYPVVLASGIDPRAGHAEVTVPWVFVGNYTLVLYGDSGNLSPIFEIRGGLEF